MMDNRLMTRATTKAVFVGGPRAGWVTELEGQPEIVEVVGIDYQPNVPLPDQPVTTERGVYVRTYAERTVDDVIGWRYEWRGWR